MTRALLALLLALAPAASGAQDVPAAPPRPAEGQPAAPPPEELGGTPQRLVATAGLTVLGGSGTGPLLGGTLGLSLFRERWAMVESVEVARRETLLLLGGGRVFPLPRRLHVVAAGLAGVHATGDPVAFLPAIGIRAELGWTPSRGIVDQVALSLTGLTDLVRSEDAAGEPVGGFRISLGLTAGFALDSGGGSR